MAKSDNNWWQKITLATQKAIAIKALHSIPTKSQIIKQNNISFIVRIVDNLARKENQKKKQNKLKKFNPFLPYDRNLFVDDIGDNHVAILNKFNVVDHHLLIITRDFEPQESLLNLDDFLALWTILQEIKGLGFYNSGSRSGASQPHKHLQLIPYPMAEEIEEAPINNLLLSKKIKGKIITLQELPFAHAITFFDDLETKSLQEKTQQTLTSYQQLLETVKIPINGEKPSQDYNLLITQEWMMIVPRTAEKFESISVNSLGFAGALLVKNQAGLEKIKQYSPLEILSKVAPAKS